jgi:hypothetical protein
MTSVYNAAANFTNLYKLSDDVLSHVPRFVGAAPIGGAIPVRNAIQAFLITFTEANYVQMVAALNSAKNALAVDDNDKLRLLISIDDGTVCYDSSRTNNNFASFGTNTINSANHNTRPEIMSAVLSKEGVGLSERFSRSVVTFQKYRAIRLGSSTESNLGTFRVSMDSTVAV